MAQYHAHTIQYGANIYRRGEMHLPKRIESILNMSPLPEFVQIVSWVSEITSQMLSVRALTRNQNDGPESHYIGNM